ncbi:MAG: hypothetical protein HKN45_06710 [Flavobacteriales bacterium]|nr:hypothetical protein [Flavobacteriales bacterium]
MADFSDSSVLKRLEDILKATSLAEGYYKDESKTIFSFVGLLSNELIQEIVREVESKLIDKGLKKSTVKRTFTILIEGLQNAYIHGLQSDEGKYLGLLVSNLGEQVHIQILGITDKKNFEKVSELVKDLNSMTPKELKAHYIDVMTNGKMSAKGGAGLGLITMALKSNAGIVLEHHELSDSRLVISSRLKA